MRSGGEVRVLRIFLCLRLSHCSKRIKELHTMWRLATHLKMRRIPESSDIWSTSFFTQLFRALSWNVHLPSLKLPLSSFLKKIQKIFTSTTKTLRRDSHKSFSSHYGVSLFKKVIQDGKNIWCRYPVDNEQCHINNLDCIWPWNSKGTARKLGIF